MKLPQVLKQAVQTEDWGLVCTVYETITGESLSPPVKTEEEVLANMEIGMSVTPIPPYPKNLSPPTLPPEPHPDDYLNPNIKTRREPMNRHTRKNSFVDDFTEAVDDLRQNRPDLEAMYKQIPGDRRPPVQLVDMTCTQCGRTDKISPVLAAGKTTNKASNDEVRPLYKCDSCSLKASPEG